VSQGVCVCYQVGVVWRQQDNADEAVQHAWAHMDWVNLGVCVWGGGVPGQGRNQCIIQYHLQRGRYKAGARRVRGQEGEVPL